MIFNPLYGKWGRFSSMKSGDDPVVENIVLRYRRVGETSEAAWSNGRYEKTKEYVDIHFEDLEDVYGEILVASPLSFRHHITPKRPSQSLPSTQAMQKSSGTLASSFSTPTTNSRLWYLVT